MMDDVIYASVKAIAQAIGKGDVTSEAVVRAHLDRIKAVNGQLNAVVLLTADNALEQARQADQARAKGSNLGRLLGVPMTIKDSVDTAGVVTTGGTQGRVDFVPENDAPVVARLRAEGAILLGKTNTSELTLNFETQNSIFGRTNNPYDLSRSSGGSSGGGASIVAVGGSPFDIGSDYGGSIRLPAHACGIAGLKPTTGRVPRTGTIIPPFNGVTEAFQQVGPMARYIEDLYLLLDIITGPDTIDPAIVPVVLGNPADVNVRQLRIAYHLNNGIQVPTDYTVDVVKQAIDVLKDVGAEVIEVIPPNIADTWEIFQNLHIGAGEPNVWDLLMAYGTDPKRSDLHWHFERENFIPLTAAAYSRAVARWQRFRSEMMGFMQSYDVIVSPVNARDAIPHGTIDSYYRGFAYTMTHNLTGMPGVSVRCGTSPEGLPVGVQVVSRHWREDVALAVAQHLESVLGGWQRSELV